MWKKVKWALALAAVPAVLGYFGCGLNKPDVPELAGPSELAISLEMRAVPDQLTADGWSSSVIEVTWRDENGDRVAGRTVNFDLGVQGQVGGTGGTFSDIGNLAPLNGPRPVAGGAEAHAVSAQTDSDGVARARYWAPFRTDQANDLTVTITSRPAGSDFRAAIFRQVDIFLRAADRSEFPGDNVCGIIVEPTESSHKVGEPVHFTATQLIGSTTDGCKGLPIARYEWFFGDGETAIGRRAGHAYTAAGTYTVMLQTTESTTGCQNDRTACTATIVVTN